MSGKRNQHVVPHKDGWAVRGAGAERATAVYPTKQPAVDKAREIARKNETELLVHGRDGQIQSKDSHGKHAFPPKG